MGNSTALSNIGAKSMLITQEWHNVMFMLYGFFLKERK
jgi:hypothetical protein